MTNNQEALAGLSLFHTVRHHYSWLLNRSILLIAAECALVESMPIPFRLVFTACHQKHILPPKDR